VLESFHRPIIPQVVTYLNFFSTVDKVQLLPTELMKINALPDNFFQVQSCKYHFTRTLW